MSTIHTDYSFEFGLYKNQKEMKDKNDISYQLQALTNLLQMPPGTNQDNPYMGIDMSGLQFAEGAEIETTKADVLYQIKNQASKYISTDLIEDITLTTSNISGSNDGSKQIVFAIQFKTGIAIAITGVQSNGYYTINKSLIDKTPFTST